MHIEKKTLRSLFLGTAGCIVLYWVLHDSEMVISLWNAFLSMLSPFLLGAGLAFILNVPMRGIESMLNDDIKRPGARRVTAILLTFAAFILVITLVFLLLIPQIGSTIDSLLPQILEFVESMETAINTFLANNPELMQWFYDNTGLQSIDWGTLAQQVLGVVGDSLTTIFSGAMTAIGSITGAVVDIVVAVVFAVVILVVKQDVQRGGYSAMNNAPQIMCMSGPMQGQVYTITAEGLVIGRDPCCQLRLPGNANGVSRRHCRIRLQGGHPVLEDLQSSCGTYLASGQRLVANQPIELVNGSRFYLGNRQNQFQITI